MTFSFTMWYLPQWLKYYYFNSNVLIYKLYQSIVTIPWGNKLLNNIFWRGIEIMCAISDRIFILPTFLIFENLPPMHIVLWPYLLPLFPLNYTYVPPIHLPKNHVLCVIVVVVILLCLVSASHLPMCMRPPWNMYTYPTNSDSLCWQPSIISSSTSVGVSGVVLGKHPTIQVGILSSLILYR